MLKKKSAVLVFVAMTMGSLFAQGVQGGCWNIGTSAFMNSIQPCGIFNCSTGLFGGALQLCGTTKVVVGCP